MEKMVIVESRQEAEEEKEKGDDDDVSYMIIRYISLALSVSWVHVGIRN